MEVETSLPAHYERNLGAINRGWSDKIAGASIQVVSFSAQPQSGVTTFATLGLSNVVLKLSEDRSVRQELLVSANDRFLGAEIASFLLSLANHLTERGQAMLRGEVIGPGSPIIPGATVRAVYAANPSPFNSSLIQFASASPATVFAYLIPITTAEARLVRDLGWRWFERGLEEQNPDICYLSRSDEISCKRS